MQRDEVPTWRIGTHERGHHLYERLSSFEAEAESSQPHECLRDPIGDARVDARVETGRGGLELVGRVLEVGLQGPRRGPQPFDRVEVEFAVPIDIG